MLREYLRLDPDYVTQEGVDLVPAAGSVPCQVQEAIGLQPRHVKHLEPGHFFRVI